ncbi:YitT family protein [Rhodobacteraceae bacterium 2376]|uniref:YitT family protein n=1 Tax=Rhabdonatronobacter sediminivivens TaxID=2743469 RepID=A0A7Z0KXY0_9RHOB|nr:YitT family protein [Rhabdonatronobacter sediminivivens]NYS25237.1 YitT family protein [Rhabdonatronobacter sediminivivens]
MTTPTPPAPQPHSLLEDAQGLLFGSLICAFGVHVLTSAGLVTGQTAGLAVLISYATGWSFGPVFFAINLPFYALALARMGMGFTVRTFVAVGLLSLFSALIPLLITFDRLHPLGAAILFGVVTGPGLLALFRHRASLGGVGILALWVQDRLGVQAGWVQLAVDAGIFALAFALIDPMLVLYSALGALIVNLIIAINHRRDRYIGT